MKRLMVIALAVCLAPLARAQDKEENPFKKAKVGDWVEYKMTTMAGGFNIEAKTKMEVTAKDDKEVTVKTTASVGGMEGKSQEMKIDLTKPYDPTQAGNLPKDAEAKIEKAGDGKEKIKVGGKDYDTTWQKMKVKAKAMGLEIESEVTVWRAKDVPLDGTVKMTGVSKVMGMDVKMTMELVDSGSKKD